MFVVDETLHRFSVWSCWFGLPGSSLFFGLGHRRTTEARCMTVVSVCSSVSIISPQLLACGLHGAGRKLSGFSQVGTVTNLLTVPVVPNCRVGSRSNGVSSSSFVDVERCTRNAALSSCADVECCINFFPSVEATALSPVEAWNSLLGMWRRATCRLSKGAQSNLQDDWAARGDSRATRGRAALKASLEI